MQCSRPENVAVMLLGSGDPAMTARRETLPEAQKSGG